MIKVSIGIRVFLGILLGLLQFVLVWAGCLYLAGAFPFLALLGNPISCLFLAMLSLVWPVYILVNIDRPTSDDFGQKRNGSASNNRFHSIAPHERGSE